MTTSPFLVGIDLGTTNSAVAYVDTTAAGAGVESFAVPQLTEPYVIGLRSVLPSFLLFPEPHEVEGGAVALPWQRSPDAVVGVYARDQGAVAPARVVMSAKSWLAHPDVDRRAPILPWGATSGRRVSPVEASTRYLTHLRDAWNATMAESQPSRGLEHQRIVLTVPASFDEEARELTVEAARGAGFAHLTLLEEPVAAFYAWLSQQADAGFDGERLVLVCDVGGGTTDLSLIRVRLEAGTPAFERVAIGDHLLLGGDNLDLALAALVERRLLEARPDARLAITQRAALKGACAAAKERLLGDDPPERVTVTVLGTGRAVVGGSFTTALTRDDVEQTLEAFLPVTPPGQLAAARDRRAGLRELGLPFETDPAITRHLASFLARAAESAVDGTDAREVGGRRMTRPDVVLFNGGFFTPEAARERVVRALTEWFGAPPRVLAGARLDAAVAIGAAAYARLRAGVGPPLALVQAGSARAYYVGLESPTEAGGVRAVCVLGRGTDEGTSHRLEHPFTVTANRPIAFALYSSMLGSDRPGDVVTLRRDAVHEHAPLVTVLRFGRRSRDAELPVRLLVAFTEVGTLDLWCESQVSEHRWRLQFQLRGAAGAAPAAPESAETVIDETAAAAAETEIRAVFHSGDESRGDTLTSRLEQITGVARGVWPLPLLRRFADVLIEVADGRRRSPALEARWLNLFGFCLRPGFGAAKDPWRVGEARKVYAAGLVHAGAVQNRVEWIVLWQRAAGGFTTGQQRDLAQQVMGDLGLGGRKPRRMNPQMERESWRLLASLERLDAGTRRRIGDAVLAKLIRDPDNASLLWSIGRLGARVPLYGPLSSVLPPDEAARWIDALLALEPPSPDLAAAVVAMAARTGDPLRDVGEAFRHDVRSRLHAAGYATDALRPLDEIVTVSGRDVSRVFGEPLPSGLRLDTVQDT